MPPCYGVFTLSRPASYQDQELTVTSRNSISDFEHFGLHPLSEYLSPGHQAWEHSLWWKEQKHQDHRLRNQQEAHQEKHQKRYADPDRHPLLQGARNVRRGRIRRKSRSLGPWSHHLQADDWKHSFRISLPQWNHYQHHEGGVFFPLEDGTTIQQILSKPRCKAPQKERGETNRSRSLIGCLVHRTFSKFWWLY